MLDLGENSPRYHDETLELAVQLGIGPIFPVGDLATQAARRSASTSSFIFCKRESLARCIRAHLSGGKTILLVKGSLAVGLTRVVEQLSRKE
jgi:UDP-N-acetylmuramyl pentapeptide synthase